MSPRVPRGKPADEPSGRRPLLRAQTVYDGSSCAGQRRVVRHSLISVPLRPSVAERRSSGDLVPGGHRIERVVYCEEEDNTILVDDDILQAMRMLICRSKSQLTRAFVAAEQQSAHRQATAHRGAAAPAVSLRRHVLPYAQWEAALAAQFPEYGALWPAYAPRLLATAAEAGTSGEGVPGGQVQYMLWLDRFQVRLPCGRFEEFEHSVLSRLHRALLARSREMSLAELLSYFDPATRSGARQCEVLQVLGSFNLGLSSRQLRQLVYDLGYADPRHPAEPVEVLRALLVVASPEMQAGQGEGEGDRRSSGGRSDGSDFISPRNSCGREARRHLRELRSTLRASRAHVYGALCGGSLLAILRRSEADGALSYPDVCELLMALQSACGVSVVARGAMERLVQHIDLSRAGRVSYLEFVAAFGLPESDEGAAARRRSRRSRRSSVYARRSSAQSDAELEDASARFGLKVMQAILSALYDRTPVMQKAFRHLDESGTGFLAEHDFEQALEVVLAHERAEHDVLQREQVHALVLSLRGSRLTDAEGRIDYPAFIQSFVVVDTLNAM
ncbi:hypothetical protein EMIHUDRAFT_452029 [Emiliania huxleyi CCMP1516]|uniref:EF-hand domain-containing protein n=2 Tax=Emiliania huxleyi TaxID=2903 RepID=A0A0D3IJJ2_EMIH1|nr:hypothetical protein EMIHUDRAFT_452473 [Emiliania huxleyi CCMP1516]XP_005765545.1 hypothetical protein EMIHUDRAFT_452029 [Emiliania huxleyi CCMP1516]EOD11427.1 hypothetical protein EMIHUDRAFT_452473 [Emiliania huxleyi CCMP1516]EOD13116.1 hypothetical protein EMIHUDRAFT_452029 [Emiliania huxleyi CCMP1516]|eukprot:XP_005763856.1 hypothetical protein EMIHUDRAFT_452473 [Emiliania huxleyi CCMP1516]